MGISLFLADVSEKLNSVRASTISNEQTHDPRRTNAFWSNYSAARERIGQIVMLRRALGSWPPRRGGSRLVSQQE